MDLFFLWILRARKCGSRNSLDTVGLRLTSASEVATWLPCDFGGCRGSTLLAPRLIGKIHETSQAFPSFSSRSYHRICFWKPEKMMGFMGFPTSDSPGNPKGGLKIAISGCRLQISTSGVQWWESKGCSTPKATHLPQEIRRPGSACTVFFSYVASKILSQLANPKSPVRQTPKISKIQNPRSPKSKIQNHQNPKSPNSKIQTLHIKICYIMFQKSKNPTSPKSRKSRIQNPQNPKSCIPNFQNPKFKIPAKIQNMGRWGLT